MALQTYVPQDRLRALARGEELADRSTGSALFADITGFTALTESLRLALGERRGIEALTQRVNTVYEALIGAVERHGGSVIGFSGDAVICWFDRRDGEASRRAARCALAMQQSMRPFPDLSVKVAVGSGDARRFAVGDPQVQRIDVIAGATVARAAAGEGLARAGEVLVDMATAAALPGMPRESRTTAAGEGFQVLDAASAGTLGAMDDEPAAAPPSPLAPELLRPWVQPSVFDMESAGAQHFVPGLRPTTALFLRFDGIDYDHDEHAGAALDALVAQTQRELQGHGGVLLELVIGDKGSYLYGSFGAAQVHEDDACRAVRAAVALRSHFEARGRPVQIGLSSGTMRVGGYGSSTRTSFGAIGDDVNAAARLMGLAQPGEILISGRVRRQVAGEFRPEQTTLYRLVQQHAASFIAHTEASTDAELPRFIKDEFDAFLECGILAHGFLRLRCGECGHDKLLAFSCKRRGFCPSCGARRMSQTAAHLVDHVIPHVPVRQWVLSLPIPLRVLLAAQPELVTPVLQVVQRVVTRHLLRQAGLKADEGHGGAVTLIQRFGSAANLNIHLHCLVLDGVYCCDADGSPAFIEADAPTDDELHALLQTVIARLMKMLTRRGVLVEDMGQTYLAEPDADGEEARTLRPLQAAAITYRIAFGPRAGQKVLTLRGAMPREDSARQPLCADIDGFSLHAAVRVEAHDRKRLEQLCRYITRPALSDERVQVNAAGQVELKLKTPWRDGTTHLVLSPLEFMQRLAALVPRPRLHLIRFHGVLAPNAKLRSLVVPQGPEVEERATAAVAASECVVQTETNPDRPDRPHRIAWARLLKRVFDIDMQHCPNCGAGELKIIAAILERPVIEKILTHLGLDPQPPPRGRAREARQD